MRFNHEGVIGEISNLPGSAQIAVFHSVFVPVGKRHRGAGKKAHKLRLAEAAALGYDAAVCTVNTDNAAQITILIDNGWQVLTSFKSSKTNHRVALYFKQLDDA